jgi:hypothetical protein
VGRLCGELQEEAEAEGDRGCDQERATGRRGLGALMHRWCVGPGGCEHRVVRSGDRRAVEGALYSDWS